MRKSIFSLPRAVRVAVAASLALGAAGAQALDSTVVATGLGQSLFLTAPAGDDRLFVVNKGGTISVIDDGVVQASPLLDLSASVATASEQGLAGLAFDPDFATNGRFYVNYIDKTTQNTVLARYTMDPTSNVADPTTAQTILTIQQPAGSAIHKSGWIGFRPGDKNNLYIGSGDGGPGNDPANNAQNTQSLLGKILRIDVSGSSAGYAIPDNNPFVGQAEYAPEIWAVGLRNPWRNSFDRQTGDFWITDVGQEAREEINFESAVDAGGHNYGWRIREGDIATPTVGGEAEGLTEPVYAYPHNANGLGRSITGGYVYRGPSIEGADGRYFFADFVAGKVYSFAAGVDGTLTDLRDETAALVTGKGIRSLAAFGEDGYGNLYIVGLNGTVAKLVPEPGTYALVGLGLAVAAGVARRRAVAC